MGALAPALRPRLIGIFARTHPPRRFSGAGALAIMRAIFCVSSPVYSPTTKDVIRALELHGDLELAGGSDARVRQRFPSGAHPERT